MPEDQSELGRRTKLAPDAIHRSVGTVDGELGATLFASHHLDELDPAHWQTHLDVDAPQPAQVLGLLRLHPQWSGEDGIDDLDFTLPGGATDYLLCVRFDEQGRIADIAMES